MNIIWLDLEMSGLSPKEDVILEIAAIATDKDLNIIQEGPELVIHQPDSVLESMNEWCKEHHGSSGLTQAVKDSKLSLEEAEEQILTFVKKHGKEKEIIMAGNSIWQDRAFLREHMPKLEAYFHYRMIDVSTIKELVKRWYSEKLIPEKKESHRALDDIKESIDELRAYKGRVFSKN